MKNAIIKYRKNLCLSIFLTAFLLAGYSGFGQKKQNPKDEFSIDLGGGLSGFTYHFVKGNVNQKMGGLFGVGYTHYLNANWGLSSGLEYQSYSSYASAKNITGSYNTKDIENEDFEFQYQAGKFRQLQKAGFIKIPVTVQYQPNSKEIPWYVRAGVQIGFPDNARYQTSVNDLRTGGYYPQYKVTLNDPSFMGFGSFAGEKSTIGKLDAGVAVSTIVEAGVKQELNKKSSVYLGLYLSYGINSIVKQQSKYDYLIQYQTDDPMVFSYPNIFETPYARKLRPFSIGIKFRLAIL